ncbi:hypothetical protein [Streptomyces sp. NRRL S-337]|uniref:hypothetical protein n=1 Tax=Streptomyces sp. NRRL S-337 TaxID=1463900 RepID=UPI00068ACD06|nr:hypothetical protein [Streptomyces sp. NRRL S-337]
MSAREELHREMVHNHLYMTDERADELIDAAIAEALSIYGNREALSRILAREARLGAPWLWDALAREIRAGRRLERW